MAWILKTYTFKQYYSGAPIVVETVDQTSKLISGKLVMTLDDTSKLTFSLPYQQGSVLYPLQTLCEVKWDNTTKFFGTLVKKTQKFPDNYFTFEATGVLGSYKFIPNNMSYANNATLYDIINAEKNRFKGSTSMPSPWSEVYTGHSEIPSTFGNLIIPYIGGSSTGLSCDLQNLQKTAKNSYEFLKAITQPDAYYFTSPPARYDWHWSEDGTNAYFYATDTSAQQQVKYDENLISCDISEVPFPTRVNCFSSSGGTLVTKESTKSVYPFGYPNPFYFLREQMGTKDDGTAYTQQEVQNRVDALLQQDRYVIDAVAFDKHVIDGVTTWFTMRSYVDLVLYVGAGETVTISTQITQITYDLTDSRKDRVRLGNVIKPLTERI